MAFTTFSIKSIQDKPGSTPKRVFEGGDTPGFCLQVMPTGAVSPSLQYNLGKRQFYRVGPRLPAGKDAKAIGAWLKSARRTAEDARALVEQGIDPRLHDRGNAGTVNQLLDIYVDSLAGKSSHDRVVQDLARDVRPELGHRVANGITGKDIARTLAKVRQRSIEKGYKGDGMVRLMRVRLRRSYEIGKVFDTDERMVACYPDLAFHIRANPVDETGQIKTGGPRTRNLDSGEIERVWNSLGRMVDVRTRMIIKLLLLTGWRRNTICGLRWDEVGDDVIHIKPDAVGRNKTSIDLYMPITTDIRRVLDEARRWFPDSETHVFPNSERRKLDHYSPSRLNDEIRHRLCKLAKVNHFSPHDLRRTVITQMRRAHIDGDVRRHIVGHAVKGDVHDDYDQVSWEDDLRAPVTAGLKRWHQVLRGIITPQLKAVAS